MYLLWQLEVSDKKFDSIDTISPEFYSYVQESVLNIISKVFVGIDNEILDKCNNEMQIADKTELISKQDIWRYYADIVFKYINKVSVQREIKLSDYKLVSIAPYVMRFEQKRLLMICIDIDNSNCSSNSYIATIERFYNNLSKTWNCTEGYKENGYLYTSFSFGEGNNKFELKTGNKILYKSYPEYFCVANPVPILNPMDNLFIEDNMNIIDIDGSQMYTKYDYIDSGVKLKNNEKDRYVFADYTYYRINADYDIIKSIDSIAQIHHSKCITVMRCSVYSDDIREIHIKLEYIKSILKQMENVWDRCFVDLSVLNKNTIFNRYKKLICTMLELNFTINNIIMSYKNKIDDILSDYDGRIQRIKHNVDKRNIDKLTEHFADYIKKCKYQMKYDLDGVGKTDARAAKISEQLSLFRDNIGIYENYNIQMFMTIFSIVVFVWGVWSLSYDKRFDYNIKVIEVLSGLGSIPHNLFIGAVVFMIATAVLSFTVINIFNTKLSRRARKVFKKQRSKLNLKGINDLIDYKFDEHKLGNNRKKQEKIVEILILLCSYIYEQKSIDSFKSQKFELEVSEILKKLEELQER